jgi:hypothetical protein
MVINLIQGDTSKVYKFQRKNADNEAITTVPQKMWLTCKNSYSSKEVVFQKTLEKGIDFSEEDHYYRFQIESEESENLECKEYGFEIAIRNEIGKKKTLLENGRLIIRNHYTKKENEV